MGVTRAPTAAYKLVSSTAASFPLVREAAVETSVTSKRKQTSGMPVEPSIVTCGTKKTTHQDADDNVILSSARPVMWGHNGCTFFGGPSCWLKEEQQWLVWKSHVWIMD